jgi:hypothetical protein
VDILFKCQVLKVTRSKVTVLFQVLCEELVYFKEESLVNDVFLMVYREIRAWNVEIRVPMNKSWNPSYIELPQCSKRNIMILWVMTLTFAVCTLVKVSGLHMLAMKQGLNILFRLYSVSSGDFWFSASIYDCTLDHSIN